MTIVAHRGGFAETPFGENSAEALRAAQRDGFCSECDVWPSRDGEPVIIHDSTLDRTTIARGAVADFTADELRTAPVPLLRDLADIVTFIEIKPPDAPRLVERIVDIMTGRSWTLLAADPNNLRRARRLMPALPTAMVIHEPAEIDAAVAEGWSAFIDRSLLSAAIGERFHREKLSVAAWTVNSREDLLRLIPMRPDLIVTDVPRRLRGWLNAIPNPANG